MEKGALRATAAAVFMALCWALFCALCDAFGFWPHGWLWLIPSVLFTLGSLPTAFILFP